MPSFPSTARCVTPDSNQMSTMFFSFSNRLPPQFGQGSLAERCLDGIAPPRIGPHLAEALCGQPRHARIEHSFAAFHANQRRYRCAPRALARKTPLGVRFDHLTLTRPSPLRRVLNAVDRVERALAEAVLVHREKPLRRCSEDHWIVTTPAVRVGVLESSGAPKRSACKQIFDDPRICFQNVKSGVRSGLGGKTARSINRIEDRQSVFHAGIEVVSAVARRRVNGARARLQIDILC